VALINLPDPGTADFVPIPDDVALLMRTRTVGDGVASGLGGDTQPEPLTAFTSDTRPTVNEVEAILQTSYSVTSGEVGGQVADGMEAAFKHAVALYAVCLIEMSFFREKADSDRLKDWKDMRDAALSAIATRNELEQTSTAPGFGSLTIGTTRSAVGPDADVLEGLD
jgi:hypothetical protein